MKYSRQKRGFAVSVQWYNYTCMYKPRRQRESVQLYNYTCMYKPRRQRVSVQWYNYTYMNKHRRQRESRKLHKCSFIFHHFAEIIVHQLHCRRHRGGAAGPCSCFISLYPCRPCMMLCGLKIYDWRARARVK